MGLNPQAGLRRPPLAAVFAVFVLCRVAVDKDELELYDAATALLCSSMTVHKRNGGAQTAIVIFFLELNLDIVVYRAGGLKRVCVCGRSNCAGWLEKEEV